MFSFSFVPYLALAYRAVYIVGTSLGPGLATVNGSSPDLPPPPVSEFLDRHRLLRRYYVKGRMAFSLSGVLHSTPYLGQSGGCHLTTDYIVRTYVGKAGTCVAGEEPGMMMSLPFAQSIVSTLCHSNCF